MGTKHPLSSETIGILTGGGNCPGLNDAIRGATDRSGKDSVSVVGILQGYEGLAKEIRTLQSVETYCPSGSLDQIMRRPGSILGLSRYNPLKESGEAKEKTLGRIR